MKGNFFVTGDCHGNLTKIINFINKHHEAISSLFIKKKDVIYLNFKSEIPDEFDVLLLSNLSTIIEHILAEDYTIDEFFELTTSNDLRIELEFVKNAFDNFAITGNFIQAYIAMVDSYFRTELESKVRNKILKKYPKRKKELNNETPDEVNPNDDDIDTSDLDN